MLGIFSLQRNGKIPFLYYIMQIQDTIIRLIENGLYARL